MSSYVDCKKLKVVVLDCAKEGFGDSKIQELFSNILALKFKGYGAEYPKNAIPADKTDYICSHQLLCEVSHGLVRPLMGYKSMTLSRANFYNMDFPALSLMRECKALEHEKAVLNRIETTTTGNRELSYDSVWTIDPEIRVNRELTNEFQKIMRAMHVLYHVEKNIPDILALGVTRFKMHRYYEYWGYRQMDSKGRFLSSIKLPNLNYEEVLLYSLSKFSDESLAHAEVFKKMWKERIEFACAEHSTPKKKSA